MSAQWDDYQRAITEADQRIESHKAGLALLIAQARFAGVPWSVIGGALGISKQAAQQRFG